MGAKLSLAASSVKQNIVKTHQSMNASIGEGFMGDRIEGSPSFGESRRRRRIRLSGGLKKCQRNIDPAQDKHCWVHGPQNYSRQSETPTLQEDDDATVKRNGGSASGLPRRKRRVTVEIDMKSLEEMEASSILNDIDLRRNLLRGIAFDFGYFFQCLSDSLKDDSEEALNSACVACVNPTLSFETNSVDGGLGE